MRRIVSPIAAAVLLTACAAPSGPAPVATGPTAATSPAMASSASAGGPATRFDGVYRPPGGSIFGSPGCGNGTLEAVIRVRGGVAYFRTFSIDVEAPVASDGSLRLQAGQALVLGKFDGDAFTGTYTRNRCQYTLNYHR